MKNVSNTFKFYTREKLPTFNCSLTLKNNDFCKCVAIVSTGDCTTNPLRQSYPDTRQRPCF